MKEIRFYRVQDNYGCFSNFARYPIRLKGVIWSTSEHYFQAQKFSGTEDEIEIRNAKSAIVAAKMGRDRTRVIRADWERVKNTIMYVAVRAKFQQHIDIRQILLSTGSVDIVEHTANDSYWGDGGNGRGKNCLGKILMKVREELREKRRC